MANLILQTKNGKINLSQINFGIDFSLVEFKDISQRKGIKSTTIIIPYTPENNKTLFFPFDDNRIDIPNKNKKVDFDLIINGIIFLSGILKVNKINKTAKTAEIILISGNAGWYSLLDGKEITDIDLTAGTHLWNKQNITASFNNTGDKNIFVYPLIDYGLFGSSLPSQEVGLERMKPAIFEQAILRQMFNEIGYKIAGNPLNIKEIRDTILPLTKKMIITDDQLAVIQDRELVKVKTNTEFHYIDAGGLIIFDKEIQDKNNNFQSDRKYTVPRDGTYQFFINNLDIWFKDVEFTFELIHETSTSTNIIDSETFDSRINPTALFALSIKDNKITFGTGSTAINRLLNTTVTAQAGDKLFLNLTVGGKGDPFVTSKLFVKTGHEMEYKLLDLDDRELKLNDTIVPQDFLPNLNQRDFVRDFVNTWNLYFTTSEIEKKITFFFEDEFFEGIKNATNWTNKLDLSQEIEIEKLSNNYNKKILFNYKQDDSDLLIDKYNNSLNKGLGNDFEILENEYLEGEQQIYDSIYSATFDAFRFSGNLVMPTFSKKTDTVKTENTDWQPRKLIYFGLKEGKWKLQGDGSIVRPSYPYSYFIRKDAGKFDFGFAFDVPNSLGNKFQGLKETFYRKSLDLINNSEIRTAFFYLTIFDIINLNLRKPVKVKNDYFFINKIEQFNPLRKETTKVELIKIN